MYKVKLIPQGDGITKVRIAYTTTNCEAYFTYGQMCDFLYDCMPERLADMAIEHIETWYGCVFYLFDGGAVFYP